MVVAGDEERARSLFREALALAREERDTQGQILALSGLGAVAPRTRGPEGAWTLHNEALRLARRLDWQWAIAYVLHHLGDTGIRERNWPAVIAYDAECLELARALENEQMTTIALWALGWAWMFQGDAARAADALAESAAISMRLGSAENTAYCLDGFAGVALLEGDAAFAAQLAGAADATRARLRIGPFPPFRQAIDDLRASARGVLGDSAFATEYERGAGRTAEDVLAAVLKGRSNSGRSETHTAEPPAHPPTRSVRSAPGSAPRRSQSLNGTSL